MESKTAIQDDDTAADDDDMLREVDEELEIAKMKAQADEEQRRAREEVCSYLAVLSYPCLVFKTRTRCIQSDRCIFVGCAGASSELRASTVFCSRRYVLGLLDMFLGIPVLPPLLGTVQVSR